MSLSSLLKSFLVTILLFSLLFGIGYFTKSSIGDFFVQVDSYQAQIEALEPGLANQSREALIAFEPLVGNFQNSVVFAFVLLLLIAPLLTYLFVSLAESFILHLGKKKSLKYFGKSLLLGLPLLLFFYLFMESFFQSFGNLFFDRSALFLFLLYLFLFSLLSYAWYVCVAVLAHGMFRKWKLLYKKFFPLYFLFVPFFLLYLLLFGYLLYILVSVMVESFVGNDLLFHSGIFLVLLAILQLLRALFLLFFYKILSKVSISE